MKLSIIQPELKWEDREANMLHLAELMLPLFGKTDIVVLPEMFTTGFTMNHSVSEESNGKTFLWLKDISHEGNFALCGSYPVSENGRYYNRFIFINPSGNYWLLRLYLINSESPSGVVLKS